MGRLGGEEIVNHLDRPGDRQQSLGFAAQPLGDGRNRVRPRQRMADRRSIAGVATEQRRVGAVQGGDHPGPPVGRQHRPRENRGGGVRHGVMHMQNIETVVATHLGHLHGQRQGVIGILEQPVVIDDDWVEE